jgi:hypothetical protein
VDEEGQRDDAELDDDPLYEDDPDGGIPVGSIAKGCATAPGCLIAVVALVGCLFVALPLIKK